MNGFEFRYRLNGGAPTIETLPFGTNQAPSVGDMLNLDEGEVALAATGDEDLLGIALETAAGTVLGGKVRAITDADAVYAVANGHSRAKEDTVDLVGATGEQGIGDGPNGDLSVVIDSGSAAETLVRITVGKHSGDSLTGGQLNAALARAVVRVHRDYIGRGPTKAQAFFRGNVVVVIMQDVMTKAEQSLVASGQGHVVLEMRHGFQRAMGPELREIVERLTGCKVEAFMSDNHIEPDAAAEIFVLDRPVPA
ncbi:MAG: hypothetical protein QOI64_834 [Solirubrobacteraceae bacterium]|nr:hypothetical protein [Solirubrobacteraceae bacterium]